jgi:hypothetical protein
VATHQSDPRDTVVVDSGRNGEGTPTLVCLASTGVSVRAQLCRRLFSFTSSYCALRLSQQVSAVH